MQSPLFRVCLYIERFRINLNAQLMKMKEHCMRHRSLLAILGVIAAVTSSLGLAGCASTFLVTKDCYSAFLDSDENKLYNMLCETEDFRKIIAAAAIPQDKKDILYKALCKDRSGEKVRNLYASLTEQEKESLKLSFQTQGYDINYKPVEASGAARMSGLRENLQCPAQGY